MENLDVKKVEDELKMGKEIARQLQFCLNVPSCPTQTHEMFVQKILFSFDRALSLLNSNSFTSDPVTYPAGVIAGISESSTSLSAHADRPNDSSRKRKTIARWKEQVIVSPGMGLEGQLDDGFCWRKYAQKHILGSKYPRGYYRCIQHVVEGCLATKQIQRSSEDPTVFEITYSGNHTCTQQPPENQEPTAVIAPNHPQPQESHLNNFQSSLKVITGDFDSGWDQPLNQSSFQFPSTSGDPSFSIYDSAMADTFMGNLPQFPSDSPGLTGFGFEFDPDFTFDNSDFLP